MLKSQNIMRVEGIKLYDLCDKNFKIMPIFVKIMCLLRNLCDFYVIYFIKVRAKKYPQKWSHFFAQKFKF